MPKSVDYDQVAPKYDQRYAETQYAGIDRMLDGFANAPCSVLEVGCGTGHWFERLRSSGCSVVGLDRSPGMLRRAVATLGAQRLALGRAEALPFAARSFDRLVVINAMHHFDDPARFAHEAHRVLRGDGRVVVVGLDPSQGAGEWYVYKYFPRTLGLDQARYPSTQQIKAWLTAAGFRDCTDTVTHRIEMSVSARDYLHRGALTKELTSQLTLLDDHEFAEGIDRIRSDIERAEAAGEDLQLRADLRLYATFGTIAPSE